MSPDELLSELKAVYATLSELDLGGESEALAGGEGRGARKAAGSAESPEVEAAPPEPAMSLEEAFQPDQVACLICGKRGMKTLKRHIGTAHGLKPGQYRKQFNIPREQPLSATEYVEKRRQAALDKGLGDKLVAARKARKAKKKAK
jgi:predicted transcriptional regulator